jgi:hypothetical protein
MEGLYRAEDIGDLEVNWDVIETNIEAAFEFRQMMLRRRRWVTAFEAMNTGFREIALEVIDVFFRSLPESCFDPWPEDESDAFEVPLLDLLDDAPKLIERLFLLPYHDKTFQLDVFWRLRELCAGNLLVASGFLRSDNIRERQEKLVFPSKHKRVTGAELAELYLNGSPLKALLDFPVRFRMPEELRFEHCHIVGGTGHGKTQLMQKMIHADLLASQQDGRSVVVIDSQGDLIGKLIRLALFSPETPDSLAERLVVIDPADVEFPAALNLFDAHLGRVRQYSAADQERVLNGAIELYELFFGTFLGAELTQKQGVIFKYLARLMLAIPDATIHTLMQVMEEGERYRQYMELLDGSARHFFESEFFHPSFAATKKQVLRRLWGVLATPAFERMFTQKENKLDLFEAMNEGKIVLVSTAKDLLKRDGSALLGRFFIALIMQAALERSTIPEHQRTPAFVYIDEAQEYFDDSIETILNQARKYRVGLTLAHQTLDQLSPRLRSALLANTSMKCAGGVSAKDASALAPELRTTPEFIEGMRRRGPRSEFAVWIKHQTAEAIRLSIPLGYLERQPMLGDEELEALLAANRARYCGTRTERSDVLLAPMRGSAPAVSDMAVRPSQPHSAQPQQGEASRPAVTPPTPILATPGPSGDHVSEARREMVAFESGPPLEEQGLGKGGSKHRYLQSLVKNLAEEQGFKATLEAPLAGGGQIDILLEQNGVVVAVEISVSTGAGHERDKLRRCMDAGYPHIAIVLAKSKTAQIRQQALLLEDLPEEERGRVSILSPEEIPDYIASLASPVQATETIVKGYRVRVAHKPGTPAETAMRRDQVARVIAKSLSQQKN